MSATVVPASASRCSGRHTSPHDLVVLRPARRLRPRRQARHRGRRAGRAAGPRRRADGRRRRGRPAAPRALRQHRQGQLPGQPQVRAVPRELQLLLAGARLAAPTSSSTTGSTPTRRSSRPRPASRAAPPASAWSPAAAARPTRTSSGSPTWSARSRPSTPTSRSAPASACSRTARPSGCARPASTPTTTTSTPPSPTTTRSCRPTPTPTASTPSRRPRPPGLSPCSGLIAGLGETDEQLVEALFALRELGSDSIPVNFLMPFDGTPYENTWDLTPMRCVKILAMARFVCPDKEIRIAGGREMHLRSPAGPRAAGRQLDLPRRLPHLRGPGRRGRPRDDPRPRLRGARCGRSEARPQVGVARPRQAPPRRGHRRCTQCLSRADELLAFDREHVWHPYTSMTDPTPVRLVERRVRRTPARWPTARELVDGMSSWWAAIHGYAVPGARRGRTPPARRHGARDVRRAHPRARGPARGAAGRARPRRARARLPRRLRARCSVEVALKMVLQHQRGVGRPERTRMLTVRGGYHGDTFGCMSVCDPVGGMHSMFSDVLPQQVFADQPPEPGGDVDGWADGVPRPWPPRTPHELAGIVVEPLLQGAGGMYVYDAGCLRVMREVADEHGLVLVFDEIATGFGRTGTLFAADAAGVTPDIMCVGKALTGGYLTLAAVLLHRRGRARPVRLRVRRADARADLHGQPAGLRRRAGQPRPARGRRLARPTCAGINAGLTTGLEPLRGLPGRRRRTHHRRRRRGPARPPGRRGQGDRGRGRGGRVAAPVPRPDLHDAALRHHRRGRRPDLPRRSSERWRSA